MPAKVVPVLRKLPEMIEKGKALAGVSARARAGLASLRIVAIAMQLKLATSPLVLELRNQRRPVP